MSFHFDADESVLVVIARAESLRNQQEHRLETGSSRMLRLVLAHSEVAESHHLLLVFLVCLVCLVSADIDLLDKLSKEAFGINLDSLG